MTRSTRLVSLAAMAAALVMAAAGTASAQRGAPAAPAGAQTPEAIAASQAALAAPRTEPGYTAPRLAAIVVCGVREVVTGNKTMHIVNLEVQSAGGVSLVTNGGKFRGLADAYAQIDQVRQQFNDVCGPWPRRTDSPYWSRL